MHSRVGEHIIGNNIRCYIVMKTMTGYSLDMHVHDESKGNRGKREENEEDHTARQI